jgi:hypothetical protein
MNNRKRIGNQASNEFGFNVLIRKQQGNRGMEKVVRGKEKVVEKEEEEEEDLRVVVRVRVLEVRSDKNQMTRKRPQKT